MPTLYPVAGAKIYIGPAQELPDDDLTESDLGGVPWTEIKGWTNMGEVGDAANLISTDVISTQRTQKQKGTRNAGSMNNNFAVIENDPGQQAVIAAAGSNNNYPFRVIFSDTPPGGSGPSERMFLGLVMSARDAGGGANTVKTLNVTIEINTNIVRIASGAGAPGPIDPGVPPPDDSEQPDLAVGWLALNGDDPAYSTVEAALAETAGDVPPEYGAYEVVDVPSMTARSGYGGLKIVGPFYMDEAGLAALGCDVIDGVLVHDRFNHTVSYNQHYEPPVPHTTMWGDTFNIYGKFRKNPPRMPTLAEEARLGIAKGTDARTVIYVDDVGSGDGSSYLNRKSIHDFWQYSDLFGAVGPMIHQYDVVVVCGPISKFQGSLPAKNSLHPKQGTLGQHTIWMSHPVDRAIFLGRKFGNGDGGEDADWTDDAGAWYCGVPNAVLSSMVGYYHVGRVAGAYLGFTVVASVAACKSLVNSYFLDLVANRLYVNAADDANPKHNFFSPIYSPQLVCNTGTKPALGIKYWDVYGIVFNFLQFGATTAYYGGNYRWYNCDFLFSKQVPFGVTGRSFNLDTGQYIRPGTHIHDTPDIPDGREFHGCTFADATSAFYDTGFLTQVPTNTVFSFNLFLRIGKDSLNISILAGSDSHSIASQGSFENLLADGNVFEECCPQTTVIYTCDGGHWNRYKITSDAVVANGGFSAALAGTWTNLSSGGGTVTVTGGKAVFAQGAGIAAIEQAITVSPKFLRIAGASVTFAGAVITLAGAPDLSLLETSGDQQDMIVFLDAGDAQGVRTFRITAFNNTAKTVTVAPTPISHPGGNWIIGRKHAWKWTVGPTQSIKVRAGSASGLDDILPETIVTGNETSGIGAIAFHVPVSPYFFQFKCDNQTHACELDDVMPILSLAGEPAYADGLPFAKSYFDPLYNYWYVMQTSKNIHFIDGWYKDPIPNPGGENAAISLTGDICYGYAGQIAGFLADGNYIGGANHALAMRNKWVMGPPFDHTQVAWKNNITRDVEVGYRSVASSPDEIGTLTDVSHDFQHNDVHATQDFIQENSVANPARHNKVYNYDIYRSDGGAGWLISGGIYRTVLADWTNDAPTGDIFDPNSSHLPLGDEATSGSGSESSGSGAVSSPPPLSSPPPGSGSGSGGPGGASDIIAMAGAAAASNEEFTIAIPAAAEVGHWIVVQAMSSYDTVVSTSGYTEVLNITGTYWGGLYAKKMVGSVDALVTITPVTGSLNAALLWVLADFDPTTIQDAAGSCGDNASGNDLNGGPITPVTAGAFVLSGGMGHLWATPPTGYDIGVNVVHIGGGFNIVGAWAQLMVPAAEDPGPWSGGTNSIASTWVTWAARPTV